MSGAGHGSVPAVGSWVLLAAVAAAALGYASALLRLHRRSVRWPAMRTAAAAGGLGLIAAGLAMPTGSFPRHVGSHLLVAMAGPLLVALSAPGTLLLRALGTRNRRRAVRVLHSRPVRVVTWPWTALVLDTGATAALYLSPLWELTQRSPVLHTLAMAHMVLAGLLFDAVVVGVDPLPRTGLATRIAVLFVAGGTHDAMARLMYAHTLPAGVDRPAVRTGAELMSSAGTVAELGLAAAVFGGWYLRSGRELARADRRATGVRNRTRMDGSAAVDRVDQHRAFVDAAADPPIRQAPAGLRAPG